MDERKRRIAAQRRKQALLLKKRRQQKRLLILLSCILAVIALALILILTLTGKNGASSDPSASPTPIVTVEPEITPPTAEIATGKSGEFVIACEPVIPQSTILNIAFNGVTYIDYNITNCTENPSTTLIAYGSAYSKTLTAIEGYVFDSSVSVTGIESAGYTWTSNGTTAIFEITDWSKVTGDISITPIVRHPVLKIKYTGDGASVDGLSATNSEYGYEMKVLSDFTASRNGYNGCEDLGGNDLGIQQASGYQIPYNTNCSIISETYYATSTYYYYSFSCTSQFEGLIKNAYNAYNFVSSVFDFGNRNQD